MDFARIKVNGAYCVYCGMVADTVEHYPPKSVTYRGFLFPCCKECNTFAGTNFPFDFNKRVDFVKGKIRNKNSKYLKMPVWEQSEIRELKGNLKRSVSLCQEKRRVANTRIAWDVYNYLLLLVGNKFSVMTFAEYGIIINKENLLTTST